jgi:amino acid transporter
MASTYGSSRVDSMLARGRLGAVPLAGLLLAAVTPLVVVAGVIPVAYAASGMRAIPLAFLILAVVMAVFLVAYLTMAKHVREPGGFFAYISIGLNRPLGMAGALVAAVAYCQLQIGLYGLFGQSMHDLLAGRIGWPWWEWAALMVGVVAVLGVLRIDIGAWLLAPMVALEMVSIVVLALRGLAHRAAGHLTLAGFDPRLLIVAGASAAFAIGWLGLTGVEQAATYAALVRNGRRTMLAASFGVLMAVAAVYVLYSGAYQEFYGDKTAEAAADPNAAFALGGSGGLVTFVHVQLLLSIGAALLAFHNATVQYLYGLGKQRVLSAVLARTNSFDAPWVASLTQTALALGTIVAVVVAGWDPVVGMFYRLGNGGGFGVFLLLAVTAIAVTRYFWRDPHHEGPATRLLAPVVAAVALVVMVYLVATNYATILNVGPGSREAWLWPASFLIPAVLGLLRGWYLKQRRPDVYAGILHYQPTVAARPAAELTPEYRGVQL